MTDKGYFLTPEIVAARQALTERLGYSFRQSDLLNEALTHPSIMTTEGAEVNNQRLEFLGDRVIGLVIADALFSATDDEREGHLTRRYADCVENARLAKIARDLDIGSALVVQAKTNLTDKDKVLADALEAVIGAIWRDGGIDAARRVIFAIWGTLIAANTAATKDFKTQLQEYAHQHHLALPKYTITDRTGPDHALVFTVLVSCGDHQASAEGTSRRSAEQGAAEAWLKEFK